MAEEELAELSETGIEDPFEEEEAEFPTSWLEETAWELSEALREDESEEKEFLAEDCAGAVQDASKSKDVTAR